MANQTKWTEEQLSHAYEVEGTVGDPRYNARVFLIPMFKGAKDEGYASRIDWDCRLMAKGRFGPAPVDKPNLLAVGCSEDEAEQVMAQVDYALKQLKRAYPELKQGIQQKVEGLKEALPAGESVGEAESESA